MPKNYRKISQKRFLEAISNTGGLYTTIAKKLGINRHTVAEYLKKDSVLANAVQQEIDSTLDKVESVFTRACLDGDIQACMFYLKTKGKERGYTERVENDLRSSRPIVIQVDEVDAEA